jgi:hypothetical protein
LLIPSAAGCADDATGELRVAWRFADGRDCASSSVETVAVTLDGELALSTFCVEGFESPLVVGTFSDGFRSLRLDGLSYEGALLYSAQQSVYVEPGASSSRVVELEFVGGEEGTTNSGRVALDLHEAGAADDSGDPEGRNPHRDEQGVVAGQPQ